MARKVVVIGFVGSTLDRGEGPDRWSQWRPTVDLFRQEDLVIDRLELIHEQKYTKLARLVGDDILSVSPGTEVRLVEVTVKNPWDFEEVYGLLHDFVTGYDFDSDNEDYLIHITTGSHVMQICLFLLTESGHLPGKLLQSQPPGKHDRGGVGHWQAIDLDLSRYDRIANRFRLERKEDLSFLKSGIETRNAAFNDLIENIERVVVRSREPVLLLGPTGAGKSLLARRIYELKKNRGQVKGQFVEVNCATLRGDAVHSALFGHARGAFTGATFDRPGLLRAADGGILFLDEIGELGLEEQAMLLKAIEEKTFFPLGSDREAASDFQLIAGTNRDLLASVREGRFRDDLLCRIHLWTFRLPGLAERLEDIAPNLEYELNRYAEKTGDRVSFSREARALFLEYAVAPATLWSGNFRDLNAAVIRMATLAHGGRITPEIVRAEVSRLEKSWAGKGAAPFKHGNGANLLESLLSDEGLTGLDLFDRVQLALVIETCQSSKTMAEAGRRLFQASRRRKKSPNDSDRLKKYLEKWDLSWDRVKQAGRD